MLVRGVHGEQLADLEHRFIIALGGLHGLGLNSNAGGNPRFARTGAPAQLGASPSTERAGAGQRIRVDLQLQRVADRVDDDAGLPTAWQNSIYAIAPEGANADFLRMPIIDLGGDYLNEVQLAALAGNLQQYFSNALFERYVGMAGAGHTERRLLLDRLDEHRHAVAENPHRRLPFAIQRWNAEGHTGVMHALIVNAHPEQLRDLEAITMRAANTMGPLGVNGLSPSRRLFGGTLANPPQEQRVAQGVAELARRGMAAVLSQMRAVAEFPRVAGVLQVANHGFGGSSF
jgi:hypothetical protein